MTREVWARCIAAILGSLLFLFLAGWRVVDPREIGWVMQGDWQVHFLGWHFFRHEPWQVPPGVIRTYLQPTGSSLGYTDSIAIVAFLLKPLSAFLWDPFQYLGLWLLLCFALQAWFGALIASAWTPRPVLQITIGMLLLSAPTLLSRLAHPALMAHWLLLWGLWLNFREPRSTPNEILHHSALGLIGGLVHPYLAVMILVVVVARAARVMLFDRDWWSAALPLTAGVTLMIAGWWASGIFTITARENLISPGLGTFSMNLLGPFDPWDRSAFLNPLPALSINQRGEGFQYLGLGLLALCAAAAVIGLIVRARPSSRAVPLVLSLCGLTAFAIGPVVTFGDQVLVDRLSDTGSFAVFRSTGRFFWPVAYALIAGAAGLVASRTRPMIAAGILAGALTLQVADLQRWYLHMHDGARHDRPYRWDGQLQSPEWREWLSSHRHLRVLFPEYCGGATPAPFASVMYLAASFGLGINEGRAARIDAARLAEECMRLRNEIERGQLEASTVYLVAADVLAQFQDRMGATADCRTIDNVTVCIKASAAAVRDAARAVLPSVGDFLAFHIELDRIYRDQLRRNAQDIFGTPVVRVGALTQYLGYRVSGCSHDEAQRDVLSELQDGTGPLCRVNPSRRLIPAPHETLKFYEQFQTVYQTGQPASAQPTHVDMQGEAVWITEYATNRLAGFTDREARDRVFARIREASGR